MQAPIFRAVACTSAAALATAGAAPQGGNYQHFLDQWAGGNDHFAGIGGEGEKDDKTGAGGGSFDYSQYMSGGQGAQAKMSSATALGSFDYSRYMGGASGGSSMTNSSGYSGYMKKYGDYSKYTGESGSSGGGDSSNYSKYTGGSSGGGYGNYSKYTDYSRYTSGASATSPATKATGMMAAGGGDFMEKYGSGADWQSFVPKNASSSARGADVDFSSYTPFEYSKYMEGQQNQIAMSATDCHDMSCLKAWRASQLSQVDKYSAFAPKVGQDAWSDQIKDQYETNKKRIQVEENATMISHPAQEPRRALEADKKHNTTAARTRGEKERSKEERSKAATVTLGERKHSREAATAKAMEVNATAAARDSAVGTVQAARAEDLSVSPAEDSRGVDPARWVVLGSAMLVAVGMAMLAARARPPISQPEEDPDQAYLALA